MKTLYKIVRTEDGTTWDRLVSLKPPESFSHATPKEKFDFFLKEKLLTGECYLPGTTLPNRNESDFGFFLTRYNRFYDRYLSKKLEIEKRLSFEILKRYGNGRGNEFKTGKFYSVGSSSRFAVSSFSEATAQGLVELIRKLEINGKIEDVSITLEEGLSINGIPSNTTLPQIDVVIRTNSGDTYFVEVKCHEIFDTNEHKRIKLKWKYLQAEPFKRLPLNFGTLSKQSVTENGRSIDYISVDENFLFANDFGFKLSTTHFDLKQFICHLMGIVSYGSKNTDQKIHFYYLFYKNEDCFDFVGDEIYANLEEEICEIFGKFSTLFPEIDFGICYNNTFDTLKSFAKENITSTST